MALQTGTDRDIWRRLLIAGVGCGALLASLVSGAGAPTAVAAPAEPTTETEAPSPQADGPREPCTGEDCKDDDEAEPKKMSADRALSIIHNEYAQGDGGGQVSKLIDDAMNLRAQGFRPSSANAAALEDALAHRPNQTPLVEALKSTIAYQRKRQAQAAMSQAEQGPIAGPVPVIPGMTMPVG